MYNLTQLYNATTITDLVIYANYVTNDIFFILFVLAVFIVMVVALKRYSFVAGLWVASFICFIITILGAYAHLIPYTFSFLFLAATAFIGLYVFMNKEI